jgi:hypothetical protein
MRLCQCDESFTNGIPEIYSQPSAVVSTVTLRTKVYDSEQLD